METVPHLQPINRAGCEGWPCQANLLVQSFSGLVLASEELEVAYGQLQMEVTFLNRELAARNTALRSSLGMKERKLRSLEATVDAMPCGVLVIEADHSVSVINPEGRRLLGLGESHALHLDAISSASGVDLSGFLTDWPGDAMDQEFLKHAAGVRTWLAVSKRGLFHESTELESLVRQTVLILRDVTQQKETEAAREYAVKVAGLADMAMTLAHEIRNPLTSLELFAGLAAAGGEEQSTWISHIQAGIRSLAATAGNVLSFHGRETTLLAPLDLTETIRSSVDFAMPIASQANVALSLKCNDASLWINGNASGLQQVVLNMICNAIRHSAPGGAIWIAMGRDKVSLDRPGGYATIEFSDNGCGIPAECLSEIFKPGFSVERKSSGLGLAVCSQIIAQHGGTIRVLSRCGSGTTFSVEVPAL